LVGKDSDEVTISALCSFLYILDMTAFSLEVIEATMYKKLTLYIYVYQVKNRLYGKKYYNIFMCCGIHSSTSVNPTRATSFSYDINEVAFTFGILRTKTNQWK